MARSPENDSFYYDLTYSFKDYPKEAARIKELILSLSPGAKKILDVGCGTHEHAVELRKDFKIDGLDINENYLAAARLKNPEGVYVSGDMRRFSLATTYDAVVCMHSSIGYVKNLAEVEMALRCFAAHLNPGGVILVEPWYSPDSFEPGRKCILAAEAPGIKVVRVSLRRLTPEGSRIAFCFVVVRDDRFEVFEEEHDLCLLSTAQMTSAFISAGLSVSFDAGWSKGRGLFCARLAHDVSCVAAQN